MSTLRHLTSEENLKFNLDSVADDIIPSVLRLIVKWGCQTTEFQTFEEYIDQLGRECNKKFIKENTKNGKLQQRKTDDYDTSFLYSLIPAVCDNILPAGTTQWAEKIKNDPKSVENLFKKVKEVRNIKAHNDKARLQSINLKNDVEVPILELLQAAGNLYSRPQTEVDDGILKLRDKFKTLVESGIDFIKSNFAQEGREELKNYWVANRRNVNLPSEATTEIIRNRIFCNGTISYKKRETLEVLRKFPCNTLLDEIDDKLIVLQGDPGLGKSTLLKMIVDDWVGINSTGLAFHQNSKFDLIVFLECFQKIPKTVMQFLKLVYPKSLAAINLPDIVLQDSLSHLKILLIIDGYDECSGKSMKMMHHLIETSMSHTNRTFLISTRPFGGHGLASYLEKTDISFKIAAINPINCLEDQITFLEKYQNELGQRKSHKLVQTFKLLPQAVTQILNTPLLLAMFCCIYMRDKSFVAEWKSEWHMFLSFRNQIESDMKSRARDIVNCDIIIGLIMNQLAKLSL